MKSNKLFLLVTLAIFGNLLTAHESKEFQLLIAFSQPTLTTVAANIGGSIVNTFGSIPFGSTIIINSLIFPADTIDIKHQTSYLVDKHGNALSSGNSIGEFRAQGVMLTDTVVPGEVIEQLILGMEFKGSKTNSLYTIGKVKIAQDENWFETFYLPVINGYGKNKNARGTAKGKAYAAPDEMSLVIVLKFTDEVHY